ISAARSGFNWLSSLTAATVNCRSNRISSARTCQHHFPNASSLAPTRSAWKNCHENPMEYWSDGALGKNISARLQYSNTPSPRAFPMSWTRKHLLDIESLSAHEITTILDTARAFKAVGERAIKKVPALRGKTVINLFV